MQISSDDYTYILIMNTNTNTVKHSCKMRIYIATLDLIQN